MRLAISRLINGTIYTKFALYIINILKELKSYLLFWEIQNILIDKVTIGAEWIWKNSTVIYGISAKYFFVKKWGFYPLSREFTLEKGNSLLAKPKSLREFYFG